MLETAKAQIEALLKGASDPEEIKAFTTIADDLKTAEEEISRKDGLIDRQAQDLKRFYLNDSPKGEPKNPDPEDEEEKEPRSFEELIEEAIKKRKDNK